MFGIMRMCVLENIPTLPVLGTPRVRGLNMLCPDGPFDDTQFHSNQGLEMYTWLKRFFFNTEAGRVYVKKKMFNS